MDYETIMKKIQGAGESLPKPLEMMAKLDKSLFVNHFTDKQFVMSKTALSIKQKALILLAAAIALDSPACIMNNVKLAKENGATNEEIMEAFALAKFAKGATSIINSAEAFAYLLNE